MYGVEVYDGAQRTCVMKLQQRAVQRGNAEMYGRLGKGLVISRYSAGVTVPILMP